MQRYVVKLNDRQSAVIHGDSVDIEGVCIYDTLKADGTKRRVPQHQYYEWVEHCNKKGVSVSDLLSAYAQEVKDRAVRLKTAQCGRKLRKVAE